MRACVHACVCVYVIVDMKSVPLFCCLLMVTWPAVCVCACVCVCVFTDVCMLCVRMCVCVGLYVRVCLGVEGG